MPRVISLRTILTFPVASFDLSRTKGDSRTRTRVDGITRVTLSGNGVDLQEGGNPTGPLEGPRNHSR